MASQNLKIGNKGYIATGMITGNIHMADLWEFDPTGVGIDEQLRLEVSIYPNPSNGIFTLQTNQFGIKMDIYDIQGRLMYSEKLGEFKSAINTNLSKGVYLLKLTSSEGSFSQKLIIQ
ncbi:MAG: T9SS type A sorting domain-containing protein [Bacteroidota bacterium]